jgi:glycerol-3-phosphate acyltransferase PlsY
MLKMILACALTGAQAYLLGSVVFGILISKIFFHDDIRKHGSGSAGMTNMIRSYGAVAGAGTIAGDVVKSMLAVWIGRGIFAAMLGNSTLIPVCGAYFAAAFAILGHTKPIFFGFHGGKGVAVSAGAVLATEPIIGAALFALFMIEFAITHIVSLGSITIALLYPIATLCYWGWKGTDLISMVFIGACTLAMAAQVLYMHRTNFQRLRNGTEFRFGEKKEHEEK